MKILNSNICKIDHDWWDKFHKEIGHKWGELDEEKASIVARYIDINDSLLDIGCGEGYFIDAMPNKRKAGLDWSEEALKRVECKTYWHDCNSFSVKIPHYDVVTAFEILEHLGHPKVFVDQLLHIATKKIILTTPRGDRGAYVVKEDQPLLEKYFDDTDYHYATYEEEDIRKLFPGRKIDFIPFETHIIAIIYV